MASVEPRPRADGTVVYRVRYRRHGRGSVHESQTFATMRAAEQFARHVERVGADAALDILESREGGIEPVTLAQWCLEYIDTLTGITDGTRSRYRQYATKGYGILGDLPLTAITEKGVATWVNQLTAEGKASKTIANKHGFLSAALDRARDLGMIPANPCARTRLTDTRTSTDMVFLTHAEFAQLLVYVRPDAHDVVIALVGTGHRFGEETALQARDWDSATRRIHIQRAWKYSGVSSKPTLGPPKTRRSRRSHTVSPQVAEIYDRLTAGKAPSDFIHVNPKGEPWRAANFHSAIWQPAVSCANGEDWQAKRAKWEPKRGYTEGGRRKPWRTPAPEGQRLGKWPRIHDLRHSYASWMLQAGMPIVAVSRRLGHESIKTTVDTYGHLSPAEDAALDAAMEIALSPAVPEIEAPTVADLEPAVAD